MTIRIRDERHLRALTGLSYRQFDILLTTFSEVYHKQKQEAYEKGLRKRKPGGGRKGKLPTLREKLLFVLYYLKTYPTFDVLGTQFDLSRSKANENVYKILPLLYETLVYMEVLPYREINDPQELKEIVGGVEQIIIDVTERHYRRSQEEEKQKAHYSGKKNDIH